MRSWSRKEKGYSVGTTGQISIKKLMIQMNAKIQYKKPKKKEPGLMWQVRPEELEEVRLWWSQAGN